MSPRRSPLDEAHRRLGARMVEFGGWEMPLSYRDGTLAEHHACRHGAAAFDVSHLGTVTVRGPSAAAALNETLTNDLARVRPGRAQYTHLLADDASVLDDIIVWWVEDERLDVMPNASNTARVLAAMEAAGVHAVDTTAERAVIAVQGPGARAVLGRVAPEAAAVKRFGVAGFAWNGRPALVAGTGYTGEDGVECALSAADAESFWDKVVAAGAVPAGLGARDTLRLEAGLPLHGHELGPGITPLQAGLGWVVGWDKPRFAGRDALLAERERGVDRLLKGIVTEGRQPARAGCAVRISDGRGEGTVTSGNFSPELGCGIALAFLPPATPEGTDVEVDVRGKALPGRVVATPFVKRKD